MIGRVLGNYKLIAKIGEGGMGAVYRAIDLMLDREVAIKAVRPDLAREPQIVERFRSEARLLARVQHPSIATIYSFFQGGEANDELFLAMEFVAGRTLTEVLATEGPMAPARAVRLLGTALDGIEQAHAAGIIHRDLKPDNLMLTDGERLKVMDFGIARVAGTSHLTRTGLLVGTLRYMAPEQIRGEEVDQRTDVYSLGIVLYQLLTGRVPFDGTTDYSILRAQLEDPPPPPRTLAPAIPPSLERAVLRALAKDPAERFATVAELHRALRLPNEASADTAVREAPPLSLASTMPISRSVTSPAASGPGRAPNPAFETGANKAFHTAQTPAAIPPPPSAPTLETPRTRVQAPGGPTVASPVSAADRRDVTSYRPIERHAWKWVAGGAAVALIAAAGLFGIWRSLHRAEPPGPTPQTAAATSEADTPQSGIASTPPQTTAPESTGLTQAAQPSPSSTPSQLSMQRTAGGPIVPPPTSIRPNASAQRQNPAAGAGRDLGEPQIPNPAPSVTPSPAAPEPSQAPPAAEPEPQDSEPASGLPRGLQLKAVARDLVAAGERLAEVYQTFLDQKNDRDEEISANDEALQSEIEALNDAANSFNSLFNAGLFGRARARLRRPNESATRLDVRGREAEVEAKIARVEGLMAAVNPASEVRQAWNQVRAKWRLARQLAPV